MIHLTRINRAPLVVNSDLIEHIEVTPDTVIGLTTGQKFMVLESSEEVIRRIIEFRRAICDKFHPCNMDAHPAGAEPRETSGCQEGAWRKS